MSYSNNSVQLIGHLGSAPTLRNLASGQPLATVSLAVSNRYTDRSGKPADDTQWFNLKGWGQQANRMATRLDKGSRVMIQGRLSVNEYEAKDGTKRRATDITVVTFEVLERYRSADDATAVTAEGVSVVSEPELDEVPAF